MALKNPGEFTSEREYWDHLRGPENRNRRRKLQRDFKRLHPGGHGASIKFIADWLVENYAQALKSESLLKYVHDIPREALEFLSAYGQDYEPFYWHSPPGMEPKFAQCFKNAAFLLHSSNKSATEDERVPQLSYVEGIVSGCIVNPMLHAWNTKELESTKAFDWSHYAVSQWSRYFGFPLSYQDYQRVSRHLYARNDGTFPMFHKNFFPKTQKILLQIAEEREKQKN